jgi:hypothetical protein
VRAPELRFAATSVMHVGPLKISTRERTHARNGHKRRNKTITSRHEASNERITSQIQSVGRTSRRTETYRPHGYTRKKKGAHDTHATYSETFTTTGKC